MTTAKTDKKGGKPEEKMNFEKAMERLDKIVGEMESGSLSLEEMIARFEEGQSLIRFCSVKLNEVEKKVEMLVKKGGEVKTEPFEETEEEDAGEGKAGDGEKDLF
jgi:exodeoxyribonuclease VII small subunit